jgi:transcriptional regulator
MYVPPQYREERPDVLSRAMRDIELATLVTPGPRELQVSHVPMLLRETEGGAWLLEMHVARKNPHWTLAGSAVESVAIFVGPQAYVSPSYYATKREHGKVVPTWNYIAVHARGQLEAIEDGAWLHDHVSEITRRNEADRAEPWEVTDAPADYILGMTRGIVGLRLTVTGVEGAWKMNQHRSEGDRLGTIGGLEVDPGGHAVATVMRGLETERART